MKRKTVLITGASTGIGAATALEAARRGYNIALHYRSDLSGAQAVAGLVREQGVDVVMLQGDVGAPNAAQQLFAEFDENFPSLDALVNNAGMVEHAARVDEIDPERIARMMQVNLIAPMLFAKEAVLRMSTRYGGEGGVIVNVSSTAARLGGANQYVDYAASKAGLNALTKGLSDEVAGEGIRVAAIAPGVIETAIHAKGGQPGRTDVLAHLIPMQRAGTAQEVADAVLYLMSERASYVTGSVLEVTGGR